MATKTTSKSAPPKSAAAKSASKVTSARKPVASVPSKTKPVLKKGPESHKPAHAPAKAAETASKPAPKPAAPRVQVATVSLIDEKKPTKKPADGRKKTTILPPISRLRASLETPAPA